MQGLELVLARAGAGVRAGAGAGAGAAERASPAGAGYLWALAALVTTFLNLDASVVLLTPLYVAVARQRGASVLALGAQPVLLACLASSALPVSNLTNLIAAAWTGAGTAQFIVHLGPPSLAATLVGWWAYRRAAPALARRRASVQVSALAGPGSPADPGLPDTGPDAGTGAGNDAGAGAVDGSKLRAAGAVVVVVVIGFTLGYLIGAQPWMVALGAVVVLGLMTWRSGAVPGRPGA